MMLTPFEKNLEVWRQLWRVLERSQLVVQIVDARNPLLFRCIDLERYVAELCKVKEKRSLLLVNKADLLTPEQRTRWADYFNKHRIPFLFFSAVVAQTVLDGDGVSDIARHAAPTAPPGGDGDGGDGDAGDGDGDGDAVADDAPPAAAWSVFDGGGGGGGGGCRRRRGERGGERGRGRGCGARADGGWEAV